jgi:archaetidylinositol phosphate synthase
LSDIFCIARVLRFLPASKKALFFRLFMFLTSGTSFALARTVRISPEVKVMAESILDENFKSAVREQNSFIAPLERICLNWLARHAPNWLMPDHLTLLGFAAMFFAGVSYAMAQFWLPALLLVNVWLAINWFGDSLDGTLARFRDKQRPRYGFYVDHIVDVLGSLFLFCGMAASGYITPLIALLSLIAYLLLMADSFLATYTLGTFRISVFKFSPTELRLLLAIGNIYAFNKPSIQVFGAPYLFFDVACVVAIALMFAVLIASVARNTIALYRAERV